MADRNKAQQVAINALDSRLTVKEQALAKVYRDALVTIRGTMSRIYDKYAKAGKLTKAEMTKYNRYAGMEKAIIKELSPAVAKSVRDIKRLAPTEYEAAFFRTAWALDQKSGVAVNWGQVNPKAIESAISTDFTKIAMKGLTDNSKLAVRRALVDGLALGKSYPKMVKDLKKAVNTSYNQAIKILRTEGQDAQNAGADAIYDKADAKGIEGGKVWDATLDGNTRSTHQSMDGKRADKDGFFSLGGVKVKHPVSGDLPAGERINCRCRIRYEVEGYSPQLRRSREQGLIPYQTYSDWVKTYGKPKKRKK